MENQENSITQLFLNYSRKKNNINYKKLFESILFYAYNFPVKLSKRNEEHRGDFVIFIEPKIPSLIDRYEYYGTPIEAFLYTTFKGQFLSYIDLYNKKVQKSKLYYANHSVLEVTAYVEESHEIYEKDIKEEGTINLEDIINKFRETKYFEVFKYRMWLYLQKYSPYIEEERLSELASMIGITPQVCRNTLNILSLAIHRVLDNKIRHKEDCNRLFTKFIDAEILYCAQSIYLGQQEKVEMQKKIDHAHTSYRKNYEIYKNMKFCISNETLAKLNGTTKGSVDSSLYHLRRMCGKYLNSPS